MRNRIAAVVFVSAAIAGGCTAAGSTPATAPPITIATSVAPTTSLTPTSTKTPETTTTTDRLTEIQAIFEDLERRRLQAIYDHDEEAFRSLYANPEYLERSMVLMDVVEISDADAVSISIESLEADRPTCIAALLDVDTREAIENGTRALNVYVVERTGFGWGLSWVGEGWACDGPHPLSQ